MSLRDRSEDWWCKTKRAVPAKTVFQKCLLATIPYVPDTAWRGFIYTESVWYRCRIHAPFSFALHLRISVIFLKRNGILYLSQQIRFCWRCCYCQVMKNEYLPRNPMLKKNIPTFVFSWFHEEKGYRSYKWTFHTDISSQIVPYYIIAGDYLWVGWGFLMYRFWRISY